MEWANEAIKIIGSLSGGGLMGWFFTRRKTNAEAKGSELDNVDQAIKIWRETAEKLSSKVDELSKEVNELRSDLALVHRENKALKDYLLRQGIDYTLLKNEGN